MACVKASTSNLDPVVSRLCSNLGSSSGLWKTHAAKHSSAPPLVSHTWTLTHTHASTHAGRFCSDSSLPVDTSRRDRKRDHTITHRRAFTQHVRIPVCRDFIYFYGFHLKERFFAVICVKWNNLALVKNDKPNLRIMRSLFFPQLPALYSRRSVTVIWV